MFVRERVSAHRKLNVQTRLDAKNLCIQTNLLFKEFGGGQAGDFNTKVIGNDVTSPAPVVRVEGGLCVFVCEVRVCFVCAFLPCLAHIWPCTIAVDQLSPPNFNDNHLQLWC